MTRERLLELKRVRDTARDAYFAMPHADRNADEETQVRQGIAKARLDREYLKALGAYLDAVDEFVDPKSSVSADVNVPTVCHEAPGRAGLHGEHPKGAA